MSLDNRINRIIAGLAISIVLIILLIYFGATLFTRKGEPRPRLGNRSPVETLAYCGTDDPKLCIVSFNQDDLGQMVVNFQTPNPYYPEFILSITFNRQENLYGCERGKQPLNSMICSGVMQVPGEILQFKVVSKSWGTLLAEGNFAIIGIALATPENIPTATIEGLTSTPATVTPGFPTARPTFTPFPTQTPATPSYPNPSPSYPNPSYP